MVQQLRKSITALAFFALSAPASAQAPSSPSTIRPDAPDRYVVVPGDTLWGISQKFTDSPWRWPELWGLNKEQIRNPHLIYPGYVIVLDRTKGRLSIGEPPAASPSTTAPAAAATPAEATPAAATPAEATPAAQTPAARTPTEAMRGADTDAAAATERGTVKLGPRIRSESLAKEQIPSIPANIIEPFLARPLVIEPDGLERAPTIVGTQADRVILAAGNRGYVRGMGGSKEQTWYVFRPGPPLVDPDTDRTLAYEAIYLGTAQLERPGEPATVVLTSVVQEVGAGDKLVAAGRPVPISYAPHAPAKAIRGRVISIYGSPGKVGEAGPQSIISVNRGARDGLEVGHVLGLYTRGETVRDLSARNRTIRLPDERAGLAFVFRVFNRVSYALIMSVSKPISPLDVVQTP